MQTDATRDQGTLTPAALLQLASDLARSIASASDLSAAAARFLDAVCAATGWRVGHLWVLDAENEALVPTSTWHLTDRQEYAAFVSATEGTQFGVAEGIVGRAATEVRPVSFADVRSDDRFVRADAAAACGLVGGYAFPILHDDQLVGVLEFFDTEPASTDPNLFETIAASTALLGLVAGLERSRSDLDEQSKQLRTLLEGSPDAIVVSDVSGRILAVNRAAETLFGWRASELKGRNIIGTLVPDDVDGDRARAVAAGVFSDTGNPSRAQTTGITRAGESFPMEFTLSPLEVGGDRLMYAFARDISDLQASERARRLTEQRLDAAMQLARMGSWELDVATGGLKMSDVALETLGRRREHDAEIPSWDALVNLMHPDDQEHAQQRIGEMLGASGPTEIVAKFVELDGTVHWVSAWIDLEYDESGALLRAHGTTYDVLDEHRRNEPSQWYRVLIGAPQRADETGPAKSPEEIIASLYGSPMELQRRFESGQSAEPQPLTQREREILELLRDGLDATRIARQLGISIHTVRDHLKRIRQKLGVQSQLQAVVKAASLGLLRELA